VDIYSTSNSTNPIVLYYWERCWRLVVYDTRAEPSSGSAGPSVTTSSVLLPTASYITETEKK